MKWAVVALALWPAWAEAACRQALVLAVDGSGSVNAEEYRLQMDGIATALGSDAVQQVLFAQEAAPVDIAVFEWSGPDDQAMVVPWTTLVDINALAEVQFSLNTHQRQPVDLTTAIGSAMRLGFDLLEQRAGCWKRTLDISGDGPANTGPRPQDVPQDETPAGVVVNALIVATSAGAHDRRQAEIKELSSYFQSYVVRGPGAFVETALGFTDYATAMERKLLRELQSIALSDLQAPYVGANQ